ncbi:hypothetical protein LV779_38320 [Streptomyces thinghirensis]|nr:hypothetical protein [Streptomyces thinghirensis]
MGDEGEQRRREVMLAAADSGADGYQGEEETGGDGRPLPARRGPRPPAWSGWWLLTVTT